MIYEPLYDLEKTGISIKYQTNKGHYVPPHWHPAVELIYILNGTGNMIFGGKDHNIAAGEFVIVDSNQIHEMRCGKAFMMLVVQYSKNRMKNYVDNIDEFGITCDKNLLGEEKLEAYDDICQLLKRLPALYVTQPLGYQLQSQAIAMEILYQVLNHFSEPISLASMSDDGLDRLKEITEYIEEHYTEQISLESIASHFYLSREYFSRFFKKNMGVTFSRYVNQVRLIHIYYDICNSGEGVMELAEKHGFTNYKLFNKMFHEIYGCAPREVRKNQKGTGTD